MLVPTPHTSITENKDVLNMLYCLVITCHSFQGTMSLVSLCLPTRDEQTVCQISKNIKKFGLFFTLPHPEWSVIFSTLPPIRKPCDLILEPVLNTMEQYVKLTSDILTLSSINGCSDGRVVSTLASHQCGPGSIPGWGSDPGAVSEKALFLSELPSILGWGR